MKRINKKKVTSEKRQETRDIFERPSTHFLFIGLIIVVLSLLFFQIGFLNYAPSAHDTIQWRWSAQQLIEYNQSHKDKGLWTDNMFSGMPSYLISFPARFKFFQNIPSFLDEIISWRVTYLFIGAIGMYLLLIYLKFSPLIALFSALAFALSPHFVGLIDIGHNTKFRAIMYLPWILMAFDDMRQRKRVLSLGLFSIFLIDQLRVNHFQISYYTFLMLFIYWLTFFVKAIREKELKDFNHFTLLVIAGLVITVLAVSNPYLSTYEYSHHTIRGGASGLSFDYATSWSFGIGEILSFFVPQFYGGISPHYWGPMPFTQTFHYMGIIVFYLAIMASIFYFKETRIKALVFISITALLISFGKHLPFLSSLLLNFLPLFNKFRVPAMILVLLQFAVPILAAFGLKLFIEKIKVRDIVFNRALLISFLIALGVFLLFFFRVEPFSNLSFTSPSSSFDARLTASQLSHYKNLRYELLMQSGFLSFGILLAGIALLFVLVKGFIKKNVILVLLIGLTVFDLAQINQYHSVFDINAVNSVFNTNIRNNSNLVKESSLLREFETLETDRFLLEDEELYRIYPVEDFGNTRWSYYHQTIGGYHGAKLSRYSDIIDPPFPGRPPLLNYSIIAGVPINWNIINMLNVKYLIFNSHVDLLNNDVEPVFLDRETRNVVYRNNAVLPRAWFVSHHEIIPDVNRRFLRLSDPSYDPKYTAIVETKIPEFYFHPDAIIEMISRDIHHTTWETSTFTDSFMVISEIYYPAGWNIYINGVKTEVYPTNHLLRGIIVPAGDNTIEMKLEPESYKISVILSAIGMILAIGLTLLGLYFYYKTNYGKGVVYKIV